MFKNISTIFFFNLNIMFKIVQENVKNIYQKNVYKYLKNILIFFLNISN